VQKLKLKIETLIIGALQEFPAVCLAIIRIEQRLSRILRERL
jgi:hypothetical protein